jgi:hypothetical protein
MFGSSTANRFRSPGLRKGVRLGMMALAAVLGLAATCDIAVDFIRPNRPEFPTSGSIANAAAARRTAAEWAASISLMRGDLWADYAVTLAADPISMGGGFTGDRTREAATWAVRLAPHEARAWLLISAFNSSHQRADVGGPLKMAYYTGPNDRSLMPLRIKVALETGAIEQPELQVLAEAELRAIAKREKDPAQVLMEAYRNASPEGRRFIKSRANEFDPTLSPSLRALEQAD